MKKIVSIWAPLRYANVGDDMQAIAFALYIKQIGYDVKLYQLDEVLAKQYGLCSVQSVDELCKDVNLCIIAGGALLTPFNFVKRMIHKSSVEYEHDFKVLYQATKKYKTKFCAISMGGDGKSRTPWKWYSKWRIKFFSSDAFINGTVRLQGDVEQMKKFDKDFTYYADMLFRTEDFFKARLLPSSSKKRVCIQFKNGKYLDRDLLDEIFKYAEENDDIEFHFITTHMPKIGLTYQYVPASEKKNIFIDNYNSPEQLIGVLASCDIVITQMLHVGLLGLNNHTPFVSYRGPGKTKSFLKAIGGDWAILPDSISFESLKRDFLDKRKEDLYNRYNLNVIHSMAEDSKNQYLFCKKIVEEFA